VEGRRGGGRVEKRSRIGGEKKDRRRDEALVESLRWVKTESRVWAEQINPGRRSAS
jgi:hypothetical protein